MLDDEAGPMESTRARNFSQLFLRRMGRAKRNPSPPHLGTDGTMGFASLYPSYEGRTWPQVRRPHWCDVTVAVCRARSPPRWGWKCTRAGNADVGLVAMVAAGQGLSRWHVGTAGNYPTPLARALPHRPLEGFGTG